MENLKNLFIFTLIYPFSPLTKIDVLINVIMNYKSF